MLNLDNFTKSAYDENTESQYICIKMSYKDAKIVYNSGKLEFIKKKDWLDLITISGYEMNLQDSYGSHCDNGSVKIKNVDNKFLIFENDTATGGMIKVKIEIDRCKKCIEELANKF